MRIIFSFIAGFLIFTGSLTAQSSIDHSELDNLLKTYVDNEGWVDYQGLKNNRKVLDRYLSKLQANVPGASWTKEEKLAYWINAYNAFTLDLVTRNYPLASIRDIQSKGVDSPWDLPFIELEGKKLSLNIIEHDIIRKEFNEPRIHFAVNCASYSCPVLRNEAYTATKLDRQLDEQTRSFINDPLRNQVEGKKGKVSKLFEWYANDFTKNGSIEDYIRKYAENADDDKLKISFLDYQWQLNSQQNKP